MPDNRRESDRVLPLILQRLDRQDQLSDERHRENKERFDRLTDLKPMVERHDDWIETHGKPAEKKISDIATYVSNTQSQVSGGVKGLKLGLLLGGSGAAGAAVMKALGVIAAALPH